ncbi:MAG TPA: ATP-binding protein, partial [Tabrizicola sp.]
ELLRNLVGNALTHCPPKTVVTLHLRPGPDGLTLTVSDTGPALLDSQFHDLQRRLQPGQAMRSGTRGLGLHIVAEIAQALGATLSVERGPEGKGLALRLGLPSI